MTDMVDIMELRERCGTNNLRGYLNANELSKSSLHIFNNEKYTCNEENAQPKHCFPITPVRCKRKGRHRTSPKCRHRTPQKNSSPHTAGQKQQRLHQRLKRRSTPNTTRHL